MVSKLFSHRTTFMVASASEADISQKNAQVYCQFRTDIILNTMIHMGRSPLFLLWWTHKYSPLSPHKVVRWFVFKYHSKMTC